MTLGAHNAAAVGNALVQLMASCGVAIDGMNGNARTEQQMNDPSLAVPTVNGTKASFVDPRQKAAQDRAIYQGRIQDGLQTVMEHHAALVRALSIAPPVAEPKLALAGG